MKKVFRKLILKKYKSYFDEKELDKLNANEYIVCFDNNKWLFVIGKSDLRLLLERDHINPIRYIFDMSDRIYIQREAVIEDSESKGE